MEGMLFKRRIAGSQARMAPVVNRLAAPLRGARKGARVSHPDSARL